MAKNVSSLLTWEIYMDDTETIICRSVVRSAHEKSNKVVPFFEDVQEKPKKVDHDSDSEASSADFSQKRMPIRRDSHKKTRKASRKQLRREIRRGPKSVADVAAMQDQLSHDTGLAIDLSNWPQTLYPSLRQGRLLRTISSIKGSTPIWTSMRQRR